MIGVSSPSAASFHVDHVMQSLKWPVSCLSLSLSLSVPPRPSPPCWSPRCPEGPSPQAGVDPAGTAEPLARKRGRRGLHRPGEHCQQPPTSPINPPPHPPILCPDLPSPTYRQTFFLLYVCALVIYLHMGFSGGCMCQRKTDTVCVFILV